MALSEFKQGSVICSEGEPLRHILFITKGSVEAVFNGQSFRFEQGDVIGLCALNACKHSRTYIAASDVTIFSYPYEGFGSLEALLRDRPDVSNLLINSMCRQISEILRYRLTLRQEADSAYELATELYPQYEHLCMLYAFASKELPELSELTQASEIDTLENWLHDYYMGVSDLESPILQEFFRKPGILLGFLHRSTEDAFNILQACIAYSEYLQNISKVYLNSEGNNLFDFISELHSESINIKGADEALKPLMERLIKQISGLKNIAPEYYRQRLSYYKDSLEGKRTSQQITNVPAASGLKQNLSNSLDIILEYSDVTEEERNKFIRAVHAYTKLPDRGSSDDTVYRLREELTTSFYKIYQQVFIKSLKDPNLSTIIKMFLNFGYVDATLAGHENADYLYSIADSLKGDQEMGVYTIREWLTAIYKGQKEPSRNDFDTDYTAHIHEMKMSGKITAQEEISLLADNEEKLRFEIENVFPIVNKITFGRISIFCPLFASHNVQRGLKASMVTSAMIKVTIDEIRGIDFSAFYRETLYSNHEAGIPKESVSIEILPEIILMPNVGIRGAMWQEIEGKKRSTPARMFMPLFLLEDLKAMLMRLTAEFRWEMCRRIQGPRWSDLSDPSLTSEFFDYLQFYRTNRELSPDVRSSIKTELVRARNIYKAVFVSNYADWLQYESNGSPRLNKFVRKILVSYCPFSFEIREKLMLNPQFAELLKRYNLKQQQRITRLTNLIQKVSKTNKTVPQELLNELEFAKS